MGGGITRGLTATKGYERSPVLTIRSIPPPRKQQTFVIHRPPHKRRISIATLTGLLARAIVLETEQIEVVRYLPYDEELEKLDKLQRVIIQLKVQITVRYGKA